MITNILNNLLFIGRWGTHRVLEYLLDEGIPVDKSEGKILEMNGRQISFIIIIIQEHYQRIFVKLTKYQKKRLQILATLCYKRQQNQHVFSKIQ